MINYLIISLEAVVEPWIDGLLEPLDALLTSKSQTNETQNDSCKLSSRCDVEGPTEHVAIDERVLIVENSVSETNNGTGKSLDVKSSDHKKLDMCISEQLTNGEGSKEECDAASIGGQQQDVVSQLNVGEVSAIQEPPRIQDKYVGKMESLTTHLQQTLTMTNGLVSFDDLQTPSAELAGVLLTLPSVQPPYVEVKTEEVSLCMCP